MLRGAVLALLFFGLRALYRRLRGREGIGLGDVKLAGVAGAWLDWLDDPDRDRDRGARGARGLRRAPLRARARRSMPALKFPFGLFLAPSIWIGWLLEVTLLALARWPQPRASAISASATPRAGRERIDHEVDQRADAVPAQRIAPARPRRRRRERDHVLRGAVRIAEPDREAGEREDRRVLEIVRQRP